MRKARAFSTPGDMPSCGGGAALLNQEDMLPAGAACVQAAWSGAGGSHQLVWLSVLELVALAKQSTRPVQRLAGVLQSLLSCRCQSCTLAKAASDPCRT